MFLFFSKFINLRASVIRSSAVNYGTYSTKAFVNFTFYGVKQLESFGIFLTLLIATYFRHLLAEMIFVLFYSTVLLIFHVIVLVVVMYILNLFRFLLLSHKSMFLVKSHEHVKYEFAYCVIACLCCM